jgi:hypothetical protein
MKHSCFIKNTHTQTTKTTTTTTTTTTTIITITTSPTTITTTTTPTTKICAQNINALHKYTNHISKTMKYSSCCCL